MAFKTIHTNYGLQALAAAEATGKRINLPTMAVGDGNGNPVDPQPGQTQLVRERHRATVNRVTQDPNNPNKFSAELIIPATVGGFTLREVGVFDDAGSLFVVGNLPDTYKPDATEGAFSDTVVRVDFIVSNSSTVQIIADPNVVLVTRDWVMNNIAAANVIPGGTTGQVLAKKSNADGDTEWQDLDAANVVVDVIDEAQVLAASQTVVTWAVVTNRGLAVYINGVRIEKGVGADRWTEDTSDIVKKIKLGKSYAAGTRILGVQNEPAGSSPFPLVRDKNLSDVPDKALGRRNLDIYSTAEVNAFVPAGTVMHFARNTAPPGYLKCNGAAVSRTAYAALFAAIGTTFGAGDGFTTFNVPDLRGEFIRGWDDGRGVDGNRPFGSGQEMQLQSHNHSGGIGDGGAHSHTGSTTGAGAHNHSASMGSAGNHTHPNGDYGNGSGTGDPRVHKTREAGWHGHDAWTDAQGQHQHGLSGQRQSNNVIQNGSSGAELSSVGSGNFVQTDPAGNHAHNVGIAGNGTHQHLIVIDAAGEHVHSISLGAVGDHVHNLNIANGGNHSHGLTINATGGAETRPRNVALLICVKF